VPSVLPHKKQKRYFSVDLSDTEYDPVDLEIIGEEIISYIIDRTLSGMDVNNKVFPGYSKEYKEAEGKDDPPDLNLTGEMLESLEVLKVMPRAKQIQIGYPTGDGELLGKVKGNILGSYGKRPNSKKARDFLGLTDDALESILQRF